MHILIAFRQKASTHSWLQRTFCHAEFLCSSPQERSSFKETFLEAVVTHNVDLQANIECKQASHYLLDLIGKSIMYIVVVYQYEHTPRNRCVLPGH